MTGIKTLLEVLAVSGVRHIFVNPGSPELPLNDALVSDPRFDYILGLDELPVTAMNLLQFLIHLEPANPIPQGVRLDVAIER